MNNSVAFLILAVFLLSCARRERIESIDKKVSDTISPVKFDIGELSRDFNLIHGKYIEVKGKLSYSLNDTALYDDDDLLPNDDMRIWLVFRDSLDKNVLMRLYDKTVTIRGRVDANNKGYLNSYLTTVNDIYFIREE